jgi:hypothetical protein
MRAHTLGNGDQRSESMGAEQPKDVSRMSSVRAAFLEEWEGQTVYIRTEVLRTARGMSGRGR